MSVLYGIISSEVIPMKKRTIKILGNAQTLCSNLGKHTFYFERTHLTIRYI